MKGNKNPNADDSLFCKVHHIRFYDPGADEQYVCAACLLAELRRLKSTSASRFAWENLAPPGSYSEGVDAARAHMEAEMDLHVKDADEKRESELRALAATIAGCTLGAAGYRPGRVFDAAELADDSMETARRIMHSTVALGDK